MANNYKFWTPHAQSKIDLILTALKAVPMSRQQLQEATGLQYCAANRYLGHLRETGKIQITSMAPRSRGCRAPVYALAQEAS